MGGLVITDAIVYVICSLRDVVVALMRILVFSIHASITRLKKSKDKNQWPTKFHSVKSALDTACRILTGIEGAEVSFEPFGVRAISGAG